MTSQSFKTIVLASELYEELLHVEAEEQYRMQQLVRDALKLYMGLSYYARTQLRTVASEHAAEMPRIAQALSATVTYAQLPSAVGTV